MATLPRMSDEEQAAFRQKAGEVFRTFHVPVSNADVEHVAREAAALAVKEAMVGLRDDFKASQTSLAKITETQDAVTRALGIKMSDPDKKEESILRVQANMSHIDSSRKFRESAIEHMTKVGLGALVLAALGVVWLGVKDKLGVGGH